MNSDFKSPQDGDPGHQRVYWRSRRGMSELEQWLLPFALDHYVHLNPAEQQDYLRLLDCEDWEIFDWLQGRATPPDAGLASLISRIRS